jgi:hypothetical protein
MALGSVQLSLQRLLKVKRPGSEAGPSYPTSAVNKNGEVIHPPPPPHNTSLWSDAS